MIRTRSKIYGEMSDPDTVTSIRTTTVNKWLRGLGNKTIDRFTPGANRLLVTDGTGNITVMTMTGQYNTFIGTDDEGNIVFIDRSELSD